MSSQTRVLPITMACLLALSAHAQAEPVQEIDIPASDLVSALDVLAKQSGAQFIYRADQLRGLRTRGVRGNLPADAALDRLLQGTGYTTHRDASGAVVIVKGEPHAQAAPRPQPPRQPVPVSSQPDADQTTTTELETIQVTGSRIPRSQIEGPAPVTVMTAAEIQANGFTSVPDVLRSMTQNSGETDSPQSSGGMDFSPGAQQVDLRGLGANHTLVLVNGRRIADFPMPYRGRSNFTDISNIPIGMVDRIEVLTGSASAIYGSDAISGVVNFILKKEADGTIIDFRYGDTTRGGGGSKKLSLSSGFTRGNFNSVFGVELIDQDPLWAYERKIQDSTKDSPDPSASSRRAFLRIDYNYFEGDPDNGREDFYVDPGSACDGIAFLNGNTTYRAARDGWGYDYGPGYFCGTDEAIGYGTIISERKGANAYGSLSYQFGENSEWFADIQLGYHKMSMFSDVRSWSYMAPDGNEDGYFYNQNSGLIEYWARQFSPEEMGGLGNGTIRNTQKTFSLTTGFKGTFAQDWDYEASLSHSQYQATIGWPQIISSKANDLFLGQQLGEFTDIDGSVYPIFNADPDRLYTPLTRDEYDAIAGYANYHPKSRTDTLSFTVTNTDLFDMPAGPVGFAGVVELGNQSYAINPPLQATQYYYYSWKDSDGEGSRDRWAGAAELRMPLLDSLDLSLAGRYDQYRYGGNNVGKFTYSTGLEWRPIDTLLVRGSYGTAFRAADLHYVFAGPGNDETSGIDYYTCRLETPDAADCEDYDTNLIRSREGNRALDPETSTSWTAGMVWSPSSNFDLSADYFDIQMRDQVEDMRTDAILQDESNCRFGSRADGTPVDIDSPTCVDAISRITRQTNGSLYGIFVNPVNVAQESTSGVDLSAHYRLETPIGQFRFVGNYTWVRKHDFQQFDGDVVEDQFAVNSGFDIPRTKASASVSWEKNSWTATLHGDRIGHLPNSDSYDQLYDPEDGGSPWIGATYRYNASLQYRFTDHMQLGLAVDNLFDKMPPRDPTYTAYPYYDISWFDSLGRSFYLQFTYKFGGSAL